MAGAGNRTELIVAAWNVNRARDPDAIRKRLEATGADIWLLSEVDIGMARSGNRDNAALIAGRRAYFFDTEFFEEGFGNAAEIESATGRNRKSLHGNMVITGKALRRAFTVALDRGEPWHGDDQPRAGSRRALAVEIGGTWFVSTHLEARGKPKRRARQMRRLCRVLDGLPRVVMGGDMNNKEGAEPLFGIAERYGFDWRACNVMETVTDYPGPKLDWFFTRGVKASEPQCWSPEGLSDHDVVTVEVDVR